MPCSSKSVAAVWRASCTRVSRTAAAVRSARQPCQSSRGSRGWPVGEQKTRPQPSHGVLAARRWACWRLRWARSCATRGFGRARVSFACPLVGFGAFTAGEVPAAAGALWAFACVAGAVRWAGPFHLGAAVASFATVGRTAAAVPVGFALRRAGLAVPAGGARGDVLAAVLEAVALELPADLDRAGVEVDVFPAQADRLGLADADRERDRPAHAGARARVGVRCGNRTHIHMMWV